MSVPDVRVASTEPSATPERLWTMTQVCEYLGGVHRMTVHRWVRQHGLPAIRTPSGRLRFPERAIAEWTRRHFRVLNRL